MTKLLAEAIQHLKRLPDNMQDSAARAVLMLVEEEPGEQDDNCEGDYVILDDQCDPARV